MHRLRQLVAQQAPGVVLQSPPGQSLRSPAAVHARQPAEKFDARRCPGLPGKFPRAGHGRALEQREVAGLGCVRAAVRPLPDESVRLRR